jgi:tRNA-2-methylthio-N6-dimethylallyladenosine synthase
MLSYSITTFGCQMNVHDSQRISEVLLHAGYAEAQTPEDADVVVLNTCSVREKAEQKLLSEVGRLAKRKRTQRDLVIVVAGCVAQQEGERLLKKSPAIDLVIGPDNIHDLPGLLGQVALGGPPTVRTVFDMDEPRFLTALSVAGASPIAYVTVMKGCDERCSFCIVPYTRGPERYRASGEIFREIEALVAAGVREVTLLGQTVNSYIDPSRRLSPAPGANLVDADESEFAALLRGIVAEVPGLARLRYTSPHPRHVTPSLVRAHAELEKLAAHVHLPVQSGSNRMLRRMIRRYTREEYMERARALEAGRPGLTLSTDIIVGFPGETEEDFEATLSLVRELGFKGLFGFKYSPRPFTPALKLGDDVPEDVKSDRLARLFEVSEALLHEHLSGLIGTRQRVLIEGPSKTGDALMGRTERHEIVHVTAMGGADLIGELVSVDITGAYKHSLEGVAAEDFASGMRVPARSAPTKRHLLPVVSALEEGK